jgi:hypothetical protein
MAMVFLAGAAPAGAAVVILDNHAAEKAEFTIRRPDGKETRYSVIPGALVPIAVTSSVHIVFDADGQSHRYLLRPNSIYCFTGRDKQLALSELAMPAPRDARPPTATHSLDSALLASPAVPDSVYTVPVMILADDKEPRARAVWEECLRKRLAAASEIFARYCRVRFQVVAVGTWVGDNRIHEFTQSVAEFESEVRPAPARLAIGFTGRYKWAPGEMHVGGIRGPLRSHILIREALVKVSEPERLEVLVHELGHFLGAAHAPEGTSVMRPMLGDRRACVRGFSIGFDARNALAMYLLAETLRSRPIWGLHQLPSETRVALWRAYASLAEGLPDDPAAPRYMAMLGQTEPAKLDASPSPSEPRPQ